MFRPNRFGGEMRKGTSKFAVVERKAFEIERRANAIPGGRIIISEKGHRGMFNATTTDGGGWWLGLLLCELSVQDLKDQRYSDETVSIVGPCKENKQERFLELIFIKKMGGSRLRTLRLPARRGREGWADLGLCFLDLFNPRFRAGKPVEGKIEQLKADKANMSAQVNRSTLGKERDKITNIAATKNTIVDIEGLVNRNSITNFSWWKTAVIGKANSRLVDWEWVRRKAEEVVGVTTMSMLNKEEAILATGSQEDAWKLGEQKTFEMGGAKVTLTRWTPEFVALKGVEEQKEIQISLKGIPIHLRLEKVVTKLVSSFCSTFEINKSTIEFNSGEEVRVYVSKSRVEDVPRILILEERGYKFHVLVIINQELNPIAGTFMAESSNGGRYKGKEDITKSSGREEQGSDRVEQGAHGVPESQTRVGSGKEKEEQQPKVQHGPETGWAKVLGKKKQACLDTERTWAQVVNTNRYDPIREIVEETQVQETETEIEAHGMGSPTTAKQKPNKGKKQPFSGPTCNGFPSLKLSKQLWPKQGEEEG
ncbi:hypothetical protein FRX31_016822 [Thalictrum thalictroides]|uniref:DUF4283 domain-containing protein n=1 Tax=Thalictrum thalictroides TaxID=46969 RepID=A0A7J6W862_THATH|nr:hypothetical protein FRX31_016822 [Thalictrum thalictroides]